MTIEGPSSENNVQRGFLKETVDDLLQSFSPNVARSICSLAVPHWADRSLLQRLAGEGESLDEALRILQEFRFMQFDSQDHLRFRSEVREILLESLLEDYQQEFIEANSVAYTYFNERAVQAQILEKPSLEREALYHLLVLDEPAGIRQIYEKLEESFYYHRAGTAAILVEYAVERNHLLSASGQDWLKYFEACLELVNRSDDWGKNSFEALSAKRENDTLGALSNWKLGQLLVLDRQWSQSVRHLKQSLKILDQSDETTYRARVLMSLGEVYTDLADRSGGYTSGFEKQPSTIRRVFNIFQHLPFLVFEWLIQRVSFLPRLYFGTNYQDWIVDRLLIVAEGWVRKAEKLYAATENPVELTESRLALARLEHRIGYWTRSRRRYAVLEQDEVIRSSQYRLAKLYLGQGRASLEEGDIKKAITLLQKSALIFPKFQDFFSMGRTNYLLGRLYGGLGRQEEAAKSFLLSAQAYEQNDDSLALTQVLWSLEQIDQHITLPEQIGEEIKSLLERTPVRHVITRFPQRILFLYRVLALLVALPLTYGVVIVIGTFLGFIFELIESTILTSALGTQIPVLMFLSVFVLLALPILLALWTYRAIYSLVGLITVYILGRLLSPLEREQPAHISIDRSGITRYLSREDKQRPAYQEDEAIHADEQHLSWPDITEAFQVAFHVISQPIGLISRLYLRADSQPLVVEMVTSGYSYFLHDIRTFLSKFKPSLKIKESRFVFIDRWLTLATSLFALFFVYYLYSIGQIEITAGFEGQLITLPVSTVVTNTVLLLLRALPAVMLWRLVAYRLHQNKQFGKSVAVIPTWVIGVAAIIISAIALQYILFLLLTE